MKRSTFVAAVGGLAAGLSQSTVASALTSLPIGTSRDPNNGALLIVAKGKNYFRDNGLDVSLKYFPSAGDEVAAMASGALNIGSGGSVPTTTLRASGFQAVVLAQQADISNAQEIVAQKAIGSPKDFEGKKVGCNFGTVSEMLAETMLRHYNVPAGKVALVNLGPSDMVTALIRGDIAGASLWEPWCSQAVKGGAIRLLSGSQSYVAGQTGPQTLLGDHGLLFASKSWVDANGPTVTAVLKSLIAAQQFIAKEPDAAAQIVGAELNVPADEMKGLMARNRYSMAIDAKLIRDMNAEAAFLRGANKLKNPVQASDWVYTGPLEKVDAKLVQWRA